MSKKQLIKKWEAIRDRWQKRLRQSPHEIVRIVLAADIMTIQRCIDDLKKSKS